MSTASAGRKSPSPILKNVLNTLREHEAKLRAEGMVHAGIFASIAWGDDDTNSDADVLLDVPRGSGFGMFALIGIRDSLVKHFGRPVDVVTKRSLKSPKHDHILTKTIQAF